jgi:hypothetical protein
MAQGEGFEFKTQHYKKNKKFTKGWGSGPSGRMSA